MIVRIEDCRSASIDRARVKIAKLTSDWTSSRSINWITTTIWAKCHLSLFINTKILRRARIRLRARNSGQQLEKVLTRPLGRLLRETIIQIKSLWKQFKAVSENQAQSKSREQQRQTTKSTRPMLKSHRSARSATRSSFAKRSRSLSLRNKSIINSSNHQMAKLIFRTSSSYQTWSSQRLMYSIHW